MLRILFVLIGVWGSAGLWAANLTISGQNNQTYQNTTYDKLTITNSTNITVRNCKFSVTSGAVGDISGSNITIDSCDFNGNSNINTCTGLNIGGSYITIRKCYIHHIADDGVQVSGDHLYFHDNVIAHLMGCGSDGGCGPCYNGHSDGIEINSSSVVEFKRNIMFDIKSTSGIFFGNWGGQLTDVVMEQNLFYVPEASFGTYIHYVSGIKIYNNVFYYGVYGGIALGPSISGMVARNNICSNIDYTTDGGTYNAAQMDFDYNLVSQVLTGTTIPRMTHDVVAANPGFIRIPHYLSGAASIIRDGIVANDFNLKSNSPAIDKGTSGTDIPTTDFYGVTRTDPYDIGAFNVVKTLLQDPGFNVRDLYPFGVTMAPNPTAGRTVFALENYSDDVLPVHIAVYALDGRLARELVADGSANAVVWDGLDGAGRTCAEGYYQVRITTPRTVEYRTLVVLR